MWAALWPIIAKAATGAAVSYGMSALANGGKGSQSSTPVQPEAMEAPDVLATLMQYMKQNKSSDQHKLSSKDII